jgi:hypothetical protein
MGEEKRPSGNAGLPQGKDGREEELTRSIATVDMKLAALPSHCTPTFPLACPMDYPWQ